MSVECKSEWFNVSDDMRPVICIRRVITSDADMRPVNDVKKFDCSKDEPCSA